MSNSAPVMMIGEVADTLGVSVDRVRQLEDEGKIRARWRSRNGVRFFAPDDVRELLQARRERELARRANSAGRNSAPGGSCLHPEEFIPGRSSEAVRLAVKVAILESGKSQPEISAESGIPENRLSEIVRGWRVPRPDEMERLAAALDRPVDALFSGEAIGPQAGPAVEARP